MLVSWIPRETSFGKDIRGSPVALAIRFSSATAYFSFFCYGSGCIRRLSHCPNCAVQTHRKPNRIYSRRQSLVEDEQCHLFTHFFSFVMLANKRIFAYSEICPPKHFSVVSHFRLNLNAISHFDSITGLLKQKLKNESRSILETGCWRTCGNDNDIANLETRILSSWKMEIKGASWN